MGILTLDGCTVVTQGANLSQRERQKKKKKCIEAIGEKSFVVFIVRARVGILGAMSRVGRAGSFIFFFFFFETNPKKKKIKWKIKTKNGIVSRRVRLSRHSHMY